jgi:nitrite reductase/ring-hydroxylating ferredoxin subunit
MFLMSTIFVCNSEEVEEGGKGVRFPLLAGEREDTGFVVRYAGEVHAYLNRCAHIPIELDWNHGDFFDSSGLYIICATHGAVYAPESGYCAAGPCRGAKLYKIVAQEIDGKVYWQTDDFVTARETAA